MFDQQRSPGAGASVVGSGPGADSSAVELVEQLQGTLKALAAVDRAMRHLPEAGAAFEAGEIR